ncbi:DUF2953 domain-containing protein [Paenibacillus wynnii]|uniref:DUF2953 domain-containing protein n=1 Tax=Paenibacillus wynnii TaxID=268407 RepID=UPI0027948CDD|nr:DUF2953 domain-containing protein [Paenibacillus wynnii]MDQ0194521.1 hypothetical protein [Paenibacillus wynnii]
MTLWLAIPLALLLVAIVLLLSSSIVFHFRLRKRGKDDRVEIDISLLYGLVKLHYELPYFIFEGIKRGVSVKLEQSGVMPAVEKQSEEEGQIDKEVVDKWVDKFKKALRATKGLKKWVKDTMSHVKITQFDWSTDFSLGDAAVTATTAGAIWGLKWSMIGWGSQWVQLKKRPRTFVVPVFGEDKITFSTELACAGRLSMAYGMYAGIMLLFRAYKAERGLRQWKELIRKNNKDQREL